MAIRIIVDSSADMEEGYARAHDITIIPMTIAFGSEQYAEGVDLSREEFFERLVETDDLPRTSQIPPMVFQDLFQEAVDAGDEVVCITLSSHISGTYQSACIAAAPFKESVFVVDSENATIGERILAERAWALRDEGLSAADIAYCLNQEKKDIRLVASLDTLEYLRRGGRISGAAALVGGMLSIKPVVGVVDGDVVVLGKARGSKQSKNMVFQKIDEAGGIDLHAAHLGGLLGPVRHDGPKYIARQPGAGESRRRSGRRRVRRAGRLAPHAGRRRHRHPRRPRRRRLRLLRSRIGPAWSFALFRRAIPSSQNIRMAIFSKKLRLLA